MYIHIHVYNDMSLVLTLNWQGNWKSQYRVVICYDLGRSRLHTGDTHKEEIAQLRGMIGTAYWKTQDIERIDNTC